MPEETFSRDVAQMDSLMGGLLLQNYTVSVELSSSAGFWFFCFTTLQHILGHFGRGQLP